MAAVAVATPQIRDALGTIRAGDIEAKSGPADLVTIVDRAVENAVIALLRKRMPSVPVLGEEGGRVGPVADAPEAGTGAEAGVRAGARVRAGAGDAVGAPFGAASGSVAASRLLWVVDPLDGTNNFAHGVPLSCFCLALLDHGAPVVGVIADPHRGETFWAVRGGGAWQDANGQRRRLVVAGGRSESGEAAPAEVPGQPATSPRAATASSSVSPLAGGLTLLEVGGGWDYAHFHRVWAGLAGAGSAVRVLGSAGLSLAWVAAGRATALAFGRMQPWDIAAGLLLLEESGATVSGWGRPPVVLEGSPLVAAATVEGHRALQRLVGG